MGDYMGTNKYQGTEKMQLDKNAVLGIVFKAMENGGFGTFDTMVAICEASEVIDNTDMEECKADYLKWLRDARYEKSDFRRFCKKVKDYFEKR